MMLDERRESILVAVSQFAREALAVENFIPGETPVPVTSKVLFPEDFAAMVDACLDGWLTTGRFTEAFQRRLAEYVGVRSAVFVNSGSSANLLALSALTSKKLGDRRLVPGDEVITAALGFPTTVNPIIQNGLTPVLVDCRLPTYDIDVDQIRAAIGPRTRAIMVAHTLGNPFDVRAIRDICKKHDLWLIEDSCDALGSTVDGRHTGSFGDLATLSFYPAHHITTGEGGAVLVNSPLIRRQVESFRDWGRDCYCPTGCDDTCQKRFGWTLGQLPPGYDHKYIYSHIGYNLKATDIQAALGLSQLEHLEAFHERRSANFAYMAEGLRDIHELHLPEATPDSVPSWFGFPLTIRDSSDKRRRELLQHLERRRIATRLFFAGNITRQPGYADVNFRVISDLHVTDKIMLDSFWVGIHPGISTAMMDYVLESIQFFFRES